MITLLHTADWQIGRIYTQFEQDDAAKLTEARFETVEKIAKLGQEKKAEAILVAGDIFDAQTISDKTIRRLFNKMSAYTGQWVLISGNHDAALSESVWTRAKRLETIPANINLCLSPEPLIINNKLLILPAPLTQRHTYQDLTTWFTNHKVPKTGQEHLIKIGIAHGSIQSLLAEGIDSANPIAADIAKQANLDYLALGDWHGAKEINSRTWYSGTHETDRFKNNQSGKILEVQITGAGQIPKIETIHTGKYNWQQIEAQINLPTDIDQLITKLENTNERDVLKITLNGQCDLAGYEKLKTALEKTKAKTCAAIIEDQNLQIEPSNDDIQNLTADNFAGQVLAELKQNQNNPQTDPETKEIEKRALLILAKILKQQTSQTQNAN